MLRNAVEQRAQNFFLRTARMYGSYAAQQICRPGARAIVRARVGRALRQVRELGAPVPHGSAEGVLAEPA